MHKDKYFCYADLKMSEPPRHFEILVKHRASGVAVIAPHGGGIEGGTTELAEAVAGTEYTFYSFVGLMSHHNYETLHITSTNFDEPHALEAIKDAYTVIAIHGRDTEEKVIYVGGLDKTLKQRVVEALKAAHFNVEDDPIYKAKEPRNICNRGHSNMGMQLELTKGIREEMFENYETRKGRAIRKNSFNKFVKVIRDSLIP